ncbi:MAG TPA: metallophosphoesterase [Deltaproteobacteria bacterium]|nr:metallophosphoesterase [Deltaproteobacteria bacterium]
MSGFIIFLAVFFSLYSGLHAYGLIKLKCAFSLSPVLTLAVGLFMGLMIFAPVLIRLLERYGYDQAARVTAYVGYTWMGLLFIFVSSAFLFDIYRLLLSVSQWVANLDLSLIRLSPRQSFIISLFLTLSIAVYGAFEAVAIRTEHVIIRTSKLPKGIDRLKIVQISDVHLGLIVTEKRLERILSKVKEANPDIWVSTGDLVDGQMVNIDGLSAMLRDVPVKYGKYAVTGNHEFYAGIEKSLDFTRQAGFQVLQGETVNVSDIITIAGIDDETGDSDGLNPGLSEKDVLSKIPRDKFVLFLKHRPVLNNVTKGLFDLQLSGHAHKGQIFPFSIITALSFPADSGLLKLNTGARLYVSRGSGTWGPPIRFLSPPEVTLIELVKK